MSEKAIRWLNVSGTLAEFAMSFFFAVYLERNISGMELGHILILSVTAFAILITALIHLSLGRRKPMDRDQQDAAVLFHLTTIYMFTDSLYWIVNGRPEFYFVNMVVNAVYCLCPVLLTLEFWRIIGKMIRQSRYHYSEACCLMKWLTWILTLLMLSNAFTGLIFTVSPATGVYARGPGYYFYFGLETVMLICCAVYIMLKPMQWRDKLILMIYPFVPYINALIQDWTGGIQLLSQGTFISVFFFYSNLKTQWEREMTRREHELVRSQLNSLQQQINPHFLYNTLSSVGSLCESDPAKAQEMVFRLSDYLHDSFSDISKPAMIPFDREIMFLKHYLSIETIRFPHLRIHFELSCTEFQIPCFTLQPLVENAIKHGICKRRKSEGDVTITSECSGQDYLVSIIDNGVGFDVERLKNMEHTGHIGIENVRLRLQLLCNGTVSFSSTPGEGTVCRISIPLDENRE